MTTPTPFPWTRPGLCPIDGPTRVCPACHGSGYGRWSVSSASTAPTDCPACRGHGRIPAGAPDPGDDLDEPDAP